MTPEAWDFPESNARQQYATHSFIRYYGKLPPVVTRRILLESAKYLRHGAGLDVACGSGTTLVEAALLGIPFAGVDVNPLSVLASNVKTHPPSGETLERQWAALTRRVNRELAKVSEQGKLPPRLLDLIPGFHKRDEWFTRTAQTQLACLRYCVGRVEDRKSRDFFLVALAGIIRPASNASTRAGRIFKEVGKVPQEPWALMQRRVRRMKDGLTEFLASTNGTKINARLGDARTTKLPAGKFGLVFFHPPYFALYKYSSDVLRFELEWLGFDRKTIARREIRDGFKTTKVEDAGLFLDDIESVLIEGRRLVHRRGAMVVISNNSTLRKQELPIIEGIIGRGESVGFRLARHSVRTVRFAQASYHKSADAEIRTPRDHILFFEPV
jgi:site-specific DNA-methyltransferase (cytosine-N4-specific)